VINEEKSQTISINRYFLFCVILLLTGFKGLSQQHLVAAMSTVSFKIKNFGITVNGSFSGLRGDVMFTKNDPGQASFSASVDAASINSGISARDRHVKKPDYLYVEKFPRISFVSEKITQGDNGQYIVTGKLSIKDKSKLISFPFMVQAENGGERFTGSFTIDRREFDVGGYSISLSDNLTIFLSVYAD